MREIACAHCRLACIAIWPSHSARANCSHASSRLSSASGRMQEDHDGGILICLYGGIRNGLSLETHEIGIRRGRDLVYGLSRRRPASTSAARRSAAREVLLDLVHAGQSDEELLQQGGLLSDRNKICRRQRL